MAVNLSLRMRNELLRLIKLFMYYLVTVLSTYEKCAEKLVICDYI